MNKINWMIIATSSSIVMILILAVATRAQSERTLLIEGPRPLAKAADELEHKHGMLITYEDPDYAYVNDYDDLTAPEKRGVARAALFPRAGRLEVLYNVAEGKQNVEDPKSLLSALILDHVNRGNPGIFRISEEGEVYHLIPSEVRDRTGAMKPVGSILDATISIPAYDRTLIDAVNEVCRAVNSASSSNLLVGAYPVNLLHQRKTIRGAAKTSAREVLMSMFRDAQKNLVWRIYWIGPGRFVLNIAVPVIETTNVRGGKVWVEIPFRAK